MSARPLLQEAYQSLNRKRDDFVESFLRLSKASRESEYGDELENRIDCMAEALDHIDKALNLIREDD